MIRREFVRRALLALGAITAGSWVLHGGPRDSGGISAQLRSWFADSDEARRLGRLYLKAHPTESAEADGVIAALGRHGAHRDSLERRLGALVDADFAARRTVVLDGWLLARTEARVYAVLAAA